MKEKVGEGYERLSQKVWQEFLKYKEDLDIEVKHNHIEQGKATKHQIDVYWEVNRDNKIKKFLVEAKDHARPITKGEMGQFIATVNDIPESIGIFIARSGFQKGAIEFAKGYNIKIFELRDPKEEDFEGKMMRLELRICVKGSSKPCSSVVINGYEKIGKVLKDITEETIEIYDKNNNII